MPTYETLFITPPNLAEDDEQAVLDTMAQIVTAGGGAMLANDRMGRRRLAYPIRKFEDGIYVRFLYDSGPDVPKELERRIRLSENVLRSLTVVLERDWAEAAKVQAKRDAERRAEAAVEAAAEAERQAAAEAEKAAEAAAAPPADETTEPATTDTEETTEPATTDTDGDAGAAPAAGTTSEPEVAEDSPEKTD